MSETKQGNKTDKKSKGSNKSKKTKPGVLSRIIHSEQFPKAMGVCVAILMIFCFVCFVSFFGSWSEDYTKMQSLSPIKLLIGEQDIANWGGPIGAFISYVFIRHIFGIASFGFIILFALYVLYLFNIRSINFSKWIISVSVIMLWLSVFFGFCVKVVGLETLDVFAGTVGMAVNYWLVGIIGKVGATLFLIAFTIVFPMFLFNVRYRFVASWIRQIKQNIDERKSRKAEEKSREEEVEEEDEIDEPIFQSSETEEKIEQSKPEVIFSSLNNAHIENNDEDSLTEEEISKLTTFEFTDLSKRNNPSTEVNEDSENVEFEVETNNVNQEVSNADEESEDKVIHYGVNEPYDPKLELASFVFPNTEMLIDYEKRNQSSDESELIANKDRIVSTLRNFGIDIVKIKATPGPTVTLYEVVPASGTKISKIKNLEDDIALSLSALGIRIIAPIPGKGTIGIEVPNSVPQVVSMRTMLTSPQFINNNYELPIALGKTISSEPFVADLAKMPHLLMAGATGQGKSVGLNAIIASLLFKKHPCELKFVMVDPKKVELSLYSKIERHYLAKLPDSEEAIITDVKKVVRTLNSLCLEMDQRYELLKSAGCKKITEYNAKFCSRRLLPTAGHRFLPYIVLVVDEFADLIMTAGKEIEMPIARLAQLARAVGIHLIIATQRPSVNIITGTIKANFPARIAFKVSSKIDSRTILDTGGADRLIGRGDMLIFTGNDLTRLQCALIDTEEIEALAEFIGSQRGFNQTFLLPEYLDEDSEPSKEVDMKQLDEKFEESARLVVMHQHGSTSLIQRKLSLGYNRAGRIIDQLEAAGIVGPFEGSKAREVLVKTELELEEILKEYVRK
ncbi:MAG: DNA translocase FtsK [Bacteroidales bacterium]|nr:DNA translocase FtsK [Bacteroidales bacterium]